MITYDRQFQHSGICFTHFTPLESDDSALLTIYYSNVKSIRERDRTLEIEATVVFIKHRIVLLLLLASEETVHYSCWDNFTMDWTRYSSKQDTNTSLIGKQMQTSTQLWGSRDISPSMLDLRGIKSLETKVKPRVVTHAHQMAAKCNITHQSGWTVCTGKSFHFSLLLLHQGSQCI